MSADKAPLRRVAWVNVFDLHTVQSGFVADEYPQLVKCQLCCLARSSLLLTLVR